MKRAPVRGALGRRGDRGSVELLAGSEGQEAVGGGGLLLPAAKEVGGGDETEEPAGEAEGGGLGDGGGASDDDGGAGGVLESEAIQDDIGARLGELEPAVVNLRVLGQLHANVIQAEGRLG